MKAALCDAMNKRFANVKIQPNWTAVTLLDRRFKDVLQQPRNTAKGDILTATCQEQDCN